MAINLLHITELIFTSSLVMFGIVLALYSLALPLRKQILKFRLEERESKIVEKGEAITKSHRTTGEEKENWENRAKDLRGEIESLEKIPLYFGAGILWSNIFFILSGLTSWSIISSVEELTTQTSSFTAASAFFLVGILLFIFTGGAMFFDTKKSTENWYKSKIDEMNTRTR